MTYALGIDIGTSFTAAAVLPTGGGEDAARPLVLGRQSGPIPTVAFVGEDGDVSVGESAERRGIDQPDRLLREFKRRIGDPVPILVGERPVAAADLYALLARWVVERAEDRMGEPPAAVTLTHPATWSGYRTGLIRTALAAAGLGHAELVAEPVAAAVAYLDRDRQVDGATLAVYDFGGGTFDVAFIRLSEETLDLVGRPEGIEDLGGADFDDLVLGHVVASLGDAATRLDPGDPDALLALTRLRRECVEAKEALSFDSEVTIPVLLPGIQTRVRLVRSQFEAMIEESVQATVATLAGAAESAGV
ncbi:MAG TPA: Hsp70 family protein, partial [Naasia sp.]